MRRRTWSLFMVAGLLAGCRVHLDYELLQKHVVVADSGGRATHPQTGASFDDEATRQWVAAILAHANTACDDRNMRAAGGKRLRRLLIYVHGGLNWRSKALGEAQTVVRGIAAEGNGDWHYPIFLVWPSGGPGCYGEHLVSLRHGRRRPVYGAVTSPIVLATDITTGVARGLGNSAYQFLVDGGHSLSIASGTELLPEWRNADALYRQIQELNRTHTRFRVSRGSYRRTFLSHATRFLAYWIMLPAKFVSSTIVLDGMGRGAWTVMLRRAANVFYLAEDFDISSVRDDPERVRQNLEQQARGAMAMLMRAIRQACRDHGPAVQYEITLVAHSMGAIILNNVLRGFGDDLPIQNVVYMAPACSIEGAREALLPFLGEHPEARFYLLTLHPHAEMSEMNFLDAVPRGSLLEWIDNWYTRPESQMQMRFGKWINVIQALHVFTPCIDQVQVKAFGVEGDSMPQKHTHFNDIPFWRRSVWDWSNPRLFYERDKQDGLWPRDGR